MENSEDLEIEDVPEDVLVEEEQIQRRSDQIRNRNRVIYGYRGNNRIN